MLSELAWQWLEGGQENWCTLTCQSQTHDGNAKCQVQNWTQLWKSASSEDSDQHVHPRSLIKRRVFDDCMCLLHPNRDKWEPLSYWVDLQADMSLWWLLSSCRFCCGLDYIRTACTMGHCALYLDKPAHPQILIRSCPYRRYILQNLLSL